MSLLLFFFLSWCDGFSCYYSGSSVLSWFCSCCSRARFCCSCSDFSVFCSWNFFFHFNNPITCAFAHIIFSSSSLSQARVRARAPNTTVSSSTLSPPWTAVHSRTWMAQDVDRKMGPGFDRRICKMVLPSVLLQTHDRCSCTIRNAIVKAAF